MALLKPPSGDTQTIDQFPLTDERTHESSQLRTGSWLRGRLLLFDLSFYSFRRFALIDEALASPPARRLIASDSSICLLLIEQVTQ